MYMSSVGSELGRVKWFNSRKGFGFVTLTKRDGDTELTDVFVHHSHVCVDQEQYKYLVEGEYVSLDVHPVDGNEEWKHQAANVRGVCGGQLMCETRHTQQQRSNNTTQSHGDTNRSHGDTNRSHGDTTGTMGSGWTSVKKNRSK